MTIAHWLRFVCNRPTRDENAAITEAEWAKAPRRPEPIPAGEPIWLGLDVAWKWDTTAAVPLWWKSRAPPVRPGRDPRPAARRDLARPGLIEAALTRIHARNPIHTVVMDMSRAEQLGHWIETELGATVIDWPQSNPFAATSTSGSWTPSATAGSSTRATPA
jgi:hypothetical protein